MKLRHDVNEIAYRTVQALLGEIDKPQPPGARAKNAGSRDQRPKGQQEGWRSPKKLTQRQRSAIAQKAAWPQGAGRLTPPQLGYTVFAKKSTRGNLTLCGASRSSWRVAECPRALRRMWLAFFAGGSYTAAPLVSERKRDVSDAPHAAGLCGP